MTQQSVLLLIRVGGEPRRSIHFWMPQAHHTASPWEGQTFTVKNLVISQCKGRVLYLSDTFEGKNRDKAICDEEEYRFPEGTQLWKDTSFQGYEPEGVKTHQPKKKPRNGELSEADKRHN